MKIIAGNAASSTILPFGLFTRPRRPLHWARRISTSNPVCIVDASGKVAFESKARWDASALRSKWRSTAHGRITHPGDRSRQYRRGWNTPRERQGEKISSARPRSRRSHSRQPRRSLGQKHVSIRKLTHRSKSRPSSGRLGAADGPTFSEMLSIRCWQRLTSTPTHMQFRRRPQSMGGI